MLERYGKDLSYWEIEAEHSIDQTMCFHLLDFFTRRVPLVLARADHGLEFLDLIAKVFARRLNWSSAETQGEKQKFQLYLDREFAWKKAL
jgi:glycerol-3-phosphate dehydrogenase